MAQASPDRSFPTPVRPKRKSGRAASGKSRSCLDRVAVSEEEGLHLEEVGAAEAPAEASLEVAREVHDELLAVARAGRPRCSSSTMLRPIAQ